MVDAPVAIMMLPNAWTSRLDGVGTPYAAEIAATRRLYENPETRRRVAAFLDKAAPPAQERA